MGKGSFDGSRFKLFVTFGFSATASEIQKWRCALQAASKALFHATDAQMNIGSIVASNDNAGKNTADIVITDKPGQSGTVGTILPEKPFDQVILCSDEVMHPGVVVHELGHYLLSLEDEYLEFVDPVNLPGQCTVGPPSESACIMQFSGLGDVILSHNDCSVEHGKVRQFCCAANHTVHNNQHVFHGESCWDTIVGRWGADGVWGKFPTIVGPAAGSRPNGAPVGSSPAQLEWTDVSARSKMVFLVSDAPSAVATNADLLRLVVAPLTLTEKSLQLQFLVPDSLIPQFSIDLNKTLDETQSKVAVNVARLSVANLYRELDGPPASNQRIIMHGQPIAELRSYLSQNADRYVTDVSNAGYFSHGIADTSQFQEILFNTSGQSRLLQPGGGSFNYVWNAGQYLATAFECLEPWGILDDRLTTFPGAVHATAADEQRFSAADLNRVKHRPFAFGTTPTHHDFPVYVEAGATQIAFAVATPPDSKVWLYITRPDGTVVDPQSPSVVFSKREDYQLYVISDTTPDGLEGQWTARLERSLASGPTPFYLRAYACNAQLGMHLQVIPQADPNLFKLSVAVRYGNWPVANLGPLMAKVTELSPNGEWSQATVIELTQTPATVAASADYDYKGLFVRQSSRTSVIRINIQNVGQAVQILPTPDPSRLGTSLPQAIPNFNRVIETNIGP